MQNLSNIEKQILLKFLNQLERSLGNAGCNDFRIPNDSVHRALMEKVIRHNFPIADEDQENQLERLNDTKCKEIITMDFFVLNYLIECIKNLPENK